MFINDTVVNTGCHFKFENHYLDILLLLVLLRLKLQSIPLSPEKVFINNYLQLLYREVKGI